MAHFVVHDHLRRLNILNSHGLLAKLKEKLLSIPGGRRFNPTLVGVFFCPCACTFPKLGLTLALINLVEIYPLIDYSTNDNGHVAGEELSLSEADD